MRYACLSVAGCLLVLLPSAPAAAEDEKSAKPRDLIIGVWKPANAKEKGVTVEFTKDGKMIVHVKFKGETVDSTVSYKFIDDRKLTLTFNDPENPKQKKSEKLKVKTVSKSQLVLVNSKGKTLKYKRAK